jgi:hypothetical protein
MENTPRIYDTLISVLRQCRRWLDVRHMKTLAWMVTGLLLTEKISLTAWVPVVLSRAQYAQSTVRRFGRWLHNKRIHVLELYGPLIQQALADWGDQRLRLALDTSMLWGRYCIVRISVIYRGRAVPLVWTVLEHGSSSVAYQVYAYLLDEAAKLVPSSCEVLFLADRGFADTQLMHHLKQLGWHWRIRIKGNFQVYYQGEFHKLKEVKLAQGQARFWHQVWITQQYFGPVHLALARPNGLRECWYVISDEPTDMETFTEYGVRFDIEENFLDDKSNGFQLESSLIRSAAALSRLCLVLAVATLYLVAQGTEVVARGKRRWVDPHWFRGNSYLRIGWQWIKTALYRGLELITYVRLSGEPDPEPSRASNRQFRKRRDRRLQAISSNLFT